MSISGHPHRLPSMCRTGSRPSHDALCCLRLPRVGWTEEEVEIPARGAAPSWPRSRFAIGMPDNASSSFVIVTDAQLGGEVRGMPQNPTAPEHSPVDAVSDAYSVSQLIEDVSIGLPGSLNLR